MIFVQISNVQIINFHMVKLIVDSLDFVIFVFICSGTRNLLIVKYDSANWHVK